MRKVVLYIATSLDGYIAEENGSVSFWTRYLQNLRMSRKMIIILLRYN